MTNYSRSVLKSNGLRHPKNLPVKFGFSLKIVPATIAKKLPSQTLSQTVSHRVFQLLAQTAYVCFHGRKWVHARLSEKDRTQGLTRRNRGLPSLVHSVVLCCRRYPFYSTTLLYTYISRFSVNPQHQQKRKIRRSCRRNAVPNRFSSRFSTSRTNGPRSLSRVKVGTHSALGERSHTTAHTAKHGAFRMGALLLPSERSTRFGNPAWPGFKTANFAAFGSWSETLLKNAESLRSSDAHDARRCSEASRPRWAA